LVGHVRLGVTVIVDVDLIEHVVAELEEVRAACRILEWDEVGDERDRVWGVRTDKRIDVGVVRCSVVRDTRRFLV
jgi:hypothetical protein